MFSNDLRVNNKQIHLFSTKLQNIQFRMPCDTNISHWDFKGWSTVPSSYYTHERNVEIYFTNFQEKSTFFCQVTWPKFAFRFKLKVQC